MKMLVAEAARRGYSRASLGFAFGGEGYDARALSRSILADNPRADTIQRLAHSLGFRPLVQRALTGKFTRDDVLTASQTFADLARARLHPRDLPYAAFIDAIREALNAAGPDLRARALAECIIADEGLNDRAPLEAIAAVLAISPPEREPIAQRFAQREAVAAFLWLAKTLSLERPARHAIEIALERYLGDYPLLRKAIREAEPDWDIQQIVDPALSAAVSAFSAALPDESTIKLDGVKRT
jgi:hypothetical protein